MSQAPTPPPSPEDLDRILRAQDWGRVRARLFAFARSITHSPSQSQELADAVLVECCDPDATPWNPNAEPDVAVHALRAMRNKLSAERKKHLVRNAPKTIDTVRSLAPAARTPEERLDGDEQQTRAERIIAAARERLSEPLEHELLELSLDDVDKPADQAARVGRPIHEIRRARERVKYAIRAATDEDESEAASWKIASGHPSKS
jgi:hypothetical protein